MSTKVSIIIPVYNGEKTLSSCLNSLMYQDYPREDVEIIVVDNNSTDATKDIIMLYPVKYVFENKRNRASSRNKGIEESVGELVVFIDADCVADRHWLTNIINGFTSESVGGCGGEILSYKPQTLIEKYYDLRCLTSQKSGLIKQELFLPRIEASNAAYRRDVLEEVFLFDDSFISNEDVDLSWRVCLRGYKLNYVPQALVYHKHPNRLTDFLKKWFEFGYTTTYLVQKYTNLIKRPLVCYDECAEFLFQQIQSLKLLFITLFTGKDILEKIFPIFDITKDTLFFSGRIYGLGKIRLGIDRIPPQPNSDKPLWRIINDEVIISNPNNGDCYILNSIGSKIWILFIEGKDIPEIIDIIVSEYQAGKEEVRDDLVDFIDELKKKNLLKL